MFKKTLVAAALATATMGASAVQVAESETTSLEVYGNVAISIYASDADGDTGWALENESRVGFRGHKDLSDNLTSFFQIEGNNVYNGAGKDNKDSNGQLGQRDTFVGLKGDWGKVRIGRMLTPMYEIVDWPFSSTSMGGVFDWNSDIGAFHRDRQSDQIQYSLPTMGTFNAAFTTGRGETNAKHEDNYFYGAGASVRVADMVTFRGAVEAESARGAGAASEGSDTFGAIFAAEVTLPAGFAVKSAVKYGSVEDVATGDDNSQVFASFVGEYWSGPYGLRLNYVTAFEPSENGEGLSDVGYGAQGMYVLGGAVFYARLHTTEMNEADGDITARVGIEYGF
ncbi:MAG: porin [Psychromonas sp.]|nr:porin [Alteromonadales bacterium]MCP5077801.1 porin [Psychromonas sp.]